MKFTTTLTIEADSVAQAMKIRSEAVGSLECMSESGRLPAGASFDMDTLEQIEDDHHKALVGQAREMYAVNSDNDIEVDDNASISEGEDGIWVQGWLFLGNALLDHFGIENSARATDGEGDEQDSDS